MHPPLVLALALLLPAAAPAAGLQARLEADCLQRLRPLMPPGLYWTTVGFSALGHHAAYYVVTYRFTAPARHGKPTAACTYRRDGQWVRDDAAALQLAREPRRL